MLLSRNSTQVDSYYQLTKDGRVFVANAIVTAPVAYTNIAGMGGPLLWNNTGTGSTRVMAVILGIGIAWTTAPAATGELGITWGSGQPNAPTATTPIDSQAVTLAGGAQKPLINAYRVGTVVNPGAGLIVTHSVSTAGPPSNNVFVPMDGLVQVLPGAWAAVAGSAAIAALVANISLVWAEVPF